MCVLLNSGRRNPGRKPSCSNYQNKEPRMMKMKLHKDVPSLESLKDTKRISRNNMQYRPETNSNTWIWELITEYKHGLKISSIWDESSPQELKNNARPLCEATPEMHWRKLAEVVQTCQVNRRHYIRLVKTYLKWKAQVGRPRKRCLY